MNSILVITLLCAVPLVMAMPYFVAEEVQGKTSASLWISIRNYE
jgi:hypothetical protein